MSVEDIIKNSTLTGPIVDRLNNAPDSERKKLTSWLIQMIEPVLIFSSGRSIQAIEGRVIEKYKDFFGVKDAANGQYVVWRREFPKPITLDDFYDDYIFTERTYCGSVGFGVGGKQYNFSIADGRYLKEEGTCKEEIPEDSRYKEPLLNG